MSKVHVNGVNLYYEIEGEGFPLVLISGYTTDLSAWGYVRSELSPHFQLLMFDNRGSGRSDSPDSPTSIEEMAEDVKALMEQLGIQKAHILGHSMGGAIAQSLVYKYPHLCQKLILANSLIHLKPVQAFAIQFFSKMRIQGMPFVTMFEGSMPWFFSDHFLSNERWVKDLLHLIENYPYNPSPLGQQKQLEAILQFDSSAWFRKIEAQTLVIAGDKDKICPEDSYLLAQGLARGTLHAYGGQAHLPHLERPFDFADAVLRFLYQA